MMALGLLPQMKLPVLCQGSLEALGYGASHQEQGKAREVEYSRGL